MACKNCLIKNIKTGEISSGELDLELVGVNGYDFIEASNEDVQNIELQRAKNNKIAEIKQVRDAIIRRDIVTSKGLVFSADSEAQNNIFKALINWDANLTTQGLDPLTTQYPWGSTGLISKADLQEADILITSRKYNVYGVQAPALVKQVNACTSVEDVNAIKVQF